MTGGFKPSSTKCAASRSVCGKSGSNSKRHLPLLQTIALEAVNVAFCLPPDWFALTRTARCKCAIVLALDRVTAGEAAKFGNERALVIGIEIGQLVAENRGIGREAARAALIEAAKGRGCTDAEIENLVAWGMRAIETATNGLTQDGQPQGRNV